ncbi:MAG: DUF4845 domain-containing protein [Betaproteobacteria bacterium]|nr:DUF4845 domain-containing protein [Betaproteobacteria bacterium]
MNRQKGVALSGVIFWGIVLAMAAILGMKVAPAYVDYFSAVKAVKAIAAQATGKTVADIRMDFSKQQLAGYFKDVQASDLEITKSGNEIIISFSYEKRIPLFLNVSLAIDFQGSSARN